MDDKPTMRTWIVGGMLVLALIIGVNAINNDEPDGLNEVEPAAGSGPTATRDASPGDSAADSSRAYRSTAPTSAPPPAPASSGASGLAECGGDAGAGGICGIGFSSLDANGDRQVSPVEFERSDLSSRLFRWLDSDRDGNLSEVEITTAAGQR